MNAKIHDEKKIISNTIFSVIFEISMFAIPCVYWYP